MIRSELFLYSALFGANYYCHGRLVQSQFDNRSARCRCRKAPTAGVDGFLGQLGTDGHRPDGSCIECQWPIVFRPHPNCPQCHGPIQQASKVIHGATLVTIGKRIAGRTVHIGFCSACDVAIPPFPLDGVCLTAWLASVSYRYVIDLTFFVGCLCCSLLLFVLIKEGVYFHNTKRLYSMTCLWNCRYAGTVCVIGCAFTSTSQANNMHSVQRDHAQMFLRDSVSPPGREQC